MRVSGAYPAHAHLKKSEMFAYKRVGWGVLAGVCFGFPLIHEHLLYSPTCVNISETTGALTYVLHAILCFPDTNST